MKIEVMHMNPNANGANSHEIYNSVKEFRTWLNSACYYSQKVLLSSSFNDFIEYESTTNIVEIMKDARNYGNGYIEVYPVYEDEEED